MGELTIKQIQQRLREDGYELTISAIRSAINNKRLNVPVRVERRSTGKVLLVPESAYPEIVAYAERVQQMKAVKSTQPPEVVEARLRELHEKFPDDEYRWDLIIRFLKGEHLNAMAEREGVD